MKPSIPEPQLEKTTCLLCGSMHSTLYQEGADYFMRLPGTFYLVRCASCRLLYQNPRPPLDGIDHYYPDHYGSYSSTHVGLYAHPGLAGWLIRRAQHHRCRLLDQAVVAAPNQTRRLLDVGCASGLFLEAMQHYSGWQVEGVELNQQAAQITSKRLGIPVFAGPLEAARFPDATFDAITLWDVLEHLHDPMTSLRELRRILKPGGALFVRVPNAASYVAKGCGRYWSGYDLPRHMTAFTPRTLSHVLQQTGFDRLVCRYASGSYIAALHSLRFALDNSTFNAERAALIHRLLLHPFVRATVCLPTRLADQVFGGSNMEVLVLAHET
ncbi:MAG: hypothetical protein GFH27_549305n46 [Chloroflexi bacterium AL-W]|nr:hypothetical protein [Chloroflexi bacterium AL-N1]NOK69292.1 hypothetical protein [Chloroflexi bacterium AL-N10]NOK76353.1 hypothetical protein [Chloroflexi bacterium AL-N5]NOK83470.1 hypothetical protein [Chloroflexi bacterium AL-W]NOK91130.1 hypothetical protein [Chloroflexi bacterium AL-N15]